MESGALRKPFDKKKNIQNRSVLLSVALAEKKTDSRLGMHFFIFSFQQMYHVKKSLAHKLNEKTSK